MWAFAATMRPSSVRQSSGLNFSHFNLHLWNYCAELNQTLPDWLMEGLLCKCYLDVNWLIPKISACRARIWSLLASERSERVTNFIFCRAGWYFLVSIIFTFRWHIYHPEINHNHGYILYLYSREIHSQDQDIV